MQLDLTMRTRGNGMGSHAYIRVHDRRILRSLVPWAPHFVWDPRFQVWICMAQHGPVGTGSTPAEAQQQFDQRQLEWARQLPPARQPAAQEAQPTTPRLMADPGKFGAPTHVHPS